MKGKEIQPFQTIDRKEKGNDQDMILITPVQPTRKENTSPKEKGILEKETDM